MVQRCCRSAVVDLGIKGLIVCSTRTFSRFSILPSTLSISANLLICSLNKFDNRKADV